VGNIQAKLANGYRVKVTACRDPQWWTQHIWCSSCFYATALPVFYYQCTYTADSVTLLCKVRNSHNKCKIWKPGSASWTTG